VYFIVPSKNARTLFHHLLSSFDFSFRSFCYFFKKLTSLCLCCTQAVLLGVYADGMQPSEAATVTENLGNYLKTFGY
jgi:hypothetical protein